MSARSWMVGVGLAASAAGQVAERAISEGPFAALPQSLSVGPGTVGPAGPIAPAGLYFKPFGYAPTPPPSWVPNPLAPTLPDFTTAALFAPMVAPPDLGAMSIGLDWILAVDSGPNFGRVEIPPGHWGALTFSVTRTTVGRAPAPNRKWGRLYDETRPTVDDGAAADLWSFVLPGSENFPEAWIERTMRAQDSIEMGLFTPAGPKGDVDAHDFYMSLYQIAYLLPPGLLPAAPTFYFTVAPASLASVPSGPAGWFMGTTPSAATILQRTWNPLTMTWGPVTPFLLHSALGLGETEEVDALAVDVARGRILFSTRTASRDPLLFGKLGTDVITVTTYMRQDGEPLSSGIGLQTGDDVDAICAYDPGGDPLLLSVLGRPQNNLPLFPPPLRISASACLVQQQTTRQLHTAMAGWPRQGKPQAPPAGLAAVCFAPAGTLNPLLVGPSFTRNLVNVFGGDPRHLAFPVPPQVAGEIDVHWFAVDFVRLDYDVPFPVRIRL